MTDGGPQVFIILWWQRCQRTQQMFQGGEKAAFLNLLEKRSKEFYYGRGIVVEIWPIHSIAHNSGTMNI